MRTNFTTISAVFVPLGFIGGLFQGSIAIAIGSAIFWGVVYAFLKSKSSD